MITKVKLGFEYTFTCKDACGHFKWSEVQHNLLPDEGIEYILDSALLAASQYSSWYIGLYENAHTPAVTDDMTAAVTTAGESTDYSGSVRGTLTPDALASGVFSNAGTPTEFTFSAGATIRGGFITSSNARGTTSGLLLSIVALSSPRVMAVGDVLSVTAGLSLATV